MPGSVPHLTACRGWQALPRGPCSLGQPSVAMGLMTVRQDVCRKNDWKVQSVLVVGVARAWRLNNEPWPSRARQAKSAGMVSRIRIYKPLT